jgi:hypothetical protein
MISRYFLEKARFFLIFADIFVASKLHCSAAAAGYMVTAEIGTRFSSLLSEQYRFYRNNTKALCGTIALFSVRLQLPLILKAQKAAAKRRFTLRGGGHF